LHIITGLDKAGAESILYKLIESDTIYNHSVLSLTGDGYYGNKFNAMGIETFYLDFRKREKFFKNIINIMDIINNEHPDIVQTWMYHSDLIGGILSKICGVKKIIWSIHNIELDSKILSIIRYLSAMLSHIIPTSIVSVSREGKRFHIVIGYAKRKFSTINNGIDIEKFSITSKHKTKDINIANIARFDLIKDHSNLIKGISLVADDINKQVKYLFIGENINNDNKYLTNILSKYKLIKFVDLLGVRDNIHQLLKKVDIFILSSKSEAQPLVLMEAMASGIPCISTDVGDCKNIIGDTGWLIKKENSKQLSKAIEKAILERNTQPQKWNRRRKKCRKRIKTYFNQKIMVAKYQHLWSRV